MWLHCDIAAEYDKTLDVIVDVSLTSQPFKCAKSYFSRLRRGWLARLVWCGVCC